ncbi:FAD-dependent oxidoreductase [bacterium]|nr:FAD-dependent oxidoreductase [bacterium]
MSANYDPNNSVVIIGAAPAGMSAAIYLKRSAIDVVMLEHVAPGGQIMRTQGIDNYLGFPAGTTSVDLVMKFQEHLSSFDIEVLSETASKIVPGEILTVETSTGGKFQGKAVVVATGARPKLLGVPGEWNLFGKGVSTCAVCDGNFYKGLMVAVVGGGTTAVEDVIHLSRLVKKVYHIHRRDQLRLAGETSDELANLANVERVFSHTVEEIIGEDQVEAVRVKSRKDDSTRDIKVDGVFISVGIAPNTEFLGDLLSVDDGGFIKTDDKMVTSVEGIFAAGDVRTTDLRQVCTAVADGAVAGLAAAKHLTGIALA